MSNDGASEIELAGKSARNCEPFQGVSQRIGNSLPIGVWCIRVPTGTAKIGIPVRKKKLMSDYKTDYKTGACVAVAKGGVGESGASSFLLHKVTANIQR